MVLSAGHRRARIHLYALKLEAESRLREVVRDAREDDFIGRRQRSRIGVGALDQRPRTGVEYRVISEKAKEKETMPL